MNKISLNINNDFLLNDSFLKWLSLDDELEIIIDFISDFKSAKVFEKFHIWFIW